MHDSTRTRPRRLASALLLLLAAAPALAQRELHWRELDVRARLESDGTLAVSERHAMVFTGDWNGGERIFDLRLGQELLLDAVYRADGAGGWRKLERGSLDELDRWDQTDGSTLRWRARRPSDPEFAATEIGYRIDYRLRGILDRREHVWILDHDFAFPDRVGPIERFTLELELAPEWTATGGPPQRVVTGPLPPGASHVVTLELEHRGATVPAHAGVPRLEDDLRYGALGAAALGALLLLGWALGRERSIGRLAALDPTETMDRARFEHEVLSLPPEEVGAAWDEAIGAAEVAAVLARLQLEGKLESRVETRKVLFWKDTVLHLKLLVARDALAPHERQLVAGLFPKGPETSTELLRKHYRTSGFDPAAKLKPLLRDRLGARPGFGGKRPRPSRRPTAALVLAGLAGLVAAIVAAPSRGLASIVFALTLTVAWLPGFGAAFALRDRVERFGGPIFGIALSQALGLLALALVSSLPGATPLALAAAVLYHLGLTRATATSLQTRQSAERIERRRHLARARRWLATELRKESPGLDDRWVPWLVAFGLATEMDRWFRAFGGAGRAVPASTSWGGSGGGGSFGGGSGGWSGGGGAFGGAGATASWAAAATAMSAGVASASSSSGGGGGGGGGGSSGGGGGGGW